jgi:DNA topoisomerase-6 subunit B
MYGQLTTGKATKITSKVAEEDVAYQVELILDTKKNMPSKVREDRVIYERAHGTRVEIPLRGRYVGGKQSIPEYLKATAIVNPHARITYKPPEGESLILERASEDLPPKTKEIPPHPHGIELGTLMQMMKETKSYKLSRSSRKNSSEYPRGSRRRFPIRRASIPMSSRSPSSSSRRRRFTKRCSRRS